MDWSEFKANVNLDIEQTYLKELFNYLNDFNLLNTNQEKKIIKKIKKDLQKPMAYHLSYKFFYQSWFKVNKNVLIPRNETELIIEEFLKNDLKNKVIADVCCGSGCIGVTVAQIVSDCTIIESDISFKALSVARKNAKHLKNVKIIHSDFLNEFIKKNIKVDYLLINPPYIDKDDLNVESSVKKYEPKKALFAKNNGYEFYLRLKNDFTKVLNTNGKCIVEFGFNMYEKLKELFKDHNIEFFKDYQGNWRYFVLS